jgi:hypothetical protein
MKECRRPGGMPPRSRGSVLLIAVLVLAMLVVLGAVLTAMGEIERRVARNEVNAVRARLLAEGGIRWVRLAFDRPEILPGLPAFPGSLDGLFQGTETDPDLRWALEASEQDRLLLEAISTSILGPAAPGELVRGRIERIDLFAPPRVTEGAGEAAGFVTVKVTARLHHRTPGREVTFAERTVRAVLAEVPYAGPRGPVHSCGDLVLRSAFPFRWGEVSADGTVDLEGVAHELVLSGPPRRVAATPGEDRLWDGDGGDGFATWRETVEQGRQPIEDPWLRVVAGTSLHADLCLFPDSGPQPCPFTWNPGEPLGAGTVPHHEAGEADHSNIYVSAEAAVCPRFRYERWRAVAQAGVRRARYFAWAGGTRFREDGTGSEREFREITDGQAGLFFFDTRDGRAPRPGWAPDGNLTPPIDVVGGGWSFHGVLVLNAERFRIDGARGGPAAIRAPGEPRLTLQDGGPGPWLNLRYAESLGEPITADPDDDYGSEIPGQPVHNTRGPEVTAEAALQGVLWLAGTLDASGNGRILGSVVARESVESREAAAGATEVWWDTDLTTSGRPAGADLPRVVVAAWDPSG